MAIALTHCITTWIMWWLKLNRLNSSHHQSYSPYSYIGNKYILSFLSFFQVYDNLIITSCFHSKLFKLCSIVLNNKLSIQLLFIYLFVYSISYVHMWIVCHGYSRFINIRCCLLISLAIDHFQLTPYLQPTFHIWTCLMEEFLLYFNTPDYK